MKIIHDSGTEYKIQFYKWLYLKFTITPQSYLFAIYNACLLEVTLLEIFYFIIYSVANMISSWHFLDRVNGPVLSKLSRYHGGHRVEIHYHRLSNLCRFGTENQRHFF